MTSISSDVPEEFLGPGYMCRTPALQATWSRLCAEAPGGLHTQLSDCCFILLKPDILASGKEEMLWEKLLAAGVQPLVAWACLHSGVREFEELYKFNLTVNNDQCMLSAWWLHNRPYQMGPVICFLVRVAPEVRGGQSACDFVAWHKGPSNPFLATSGQWRHDIVSTNMALNLVHTADDPMSSARELRIFGSAEILRIALSRSQALGRNEAEAKEIADMVHGEFRMAANVVGYPRHDLDLVANLVRLKLRLAQAIGSGHWMGPDLTERFAGLLRAGGTAVERWHAYRALCDVEEERYRDQPRPEILRQLSRTSEYRFELADLLEAEVHRHRVPYSEWERVVIETTMWFSDHLPVLR